MREEEVLASKAWGERASIAEARSQGFPWVWPSVPVVVVVVVDCEFCPDIPRGGRGSGQCHLFKGVEGLIQHCHCKARHYCKMATC